MMSIAAEIQEKTHPPGTKRKISVRARTNAYLSSAAAGSFVSAFLLYIDYDMAALVSAGLSAVSFPVLAFSDRVVFDGKRIYRTGIFWPLFSFLMKNRSRVKPKQIVHVETEALRTFRRGANVTYLYRTTFQTEDVSFRIGSGRGYRAMLSNVLPLVSESCLDLRSVELRDHFQEPADINAHARSLQIPRSDVLDAASIFNKKGRRHRPDVHAGFDEIDTKKADELREVANQLRTTGKLLQALEAFRRALRLTPGNGRLIYEFARCLQSLAASQKDAGLERKAHAMMRLAERRSAGDGDLLSRLGETYFSLGAWRRAEAVFKKAADSGHSSYRVLRGLGELALRDGKIAHAINHFSDAARFAQSSPLLRWAKAEAEYLRRLNEDDEYMDIEIGRISLFDTFEGARRTTLRVFGFGLGVILAGLITSADLITNIGWAVSGVSLAIWIAASITRHAFSSRIPFELLDKE